MSRYYDHIPSIYRQIFYGKNLVFNFFNVVQINYYVHISDMLHFIVRKA